MPSTLPPALSVYRGQAKTGIGEGPGSPIAHGEQYLQGTDPLLAQDGELLRTIRPWLSLDSDPADYRRLQDQLESWSYFCYRERVFVVRLVPAGVYDRRAAYFSHARAWRLADCREGFDPGVYLGCSSLFESPQRSGESELRLAGASPQAMPVQWQAQLQQETGVAASFLGHLLQALEQDYPLIIAVPITEFTLGTPLHTLVSFARAGLPADLKFRCAIRVYTRQPELFLQHLEANLVVAPDNAAAVALGAKRNATLLNRQGEVKAGQPLTDRAAAYAQAVLQGALKAPQGLLSFSERFGPLHAAGLPASADVRSVQVSYNLALALQDAAANWDDLFNNYLRAPARAADTLPWERLLYDQDWRRFPQQILCDFVLQHPADLTTGEQELQRAVAAALGRLGLTADERLTVWWEPGNSRKHERLLQLLAYTSPLFSAAAAATRTARIPLAQFMDLGSPLYGLLRAEQQTGELRRRSQEGAALAKLAVAPENYRILAEATNAGLLDPDWAISYINAAADPTLLDTARDLLEHSQDWLRWGNAPRQALDRLRARRSLPDDLLRSIRQLGQNLDFMTHWEIYIRLADLLAPANPQTGAIAADNPLMQRLWDNLNALDSPKTHAHLVTIALDEQHWHCLEPASLVRADGEPALPWAAEVADRLLDSALVRDRLNAAALLKLLRCAGHRLDRDQIRQVYATVTAKMRQDWEKTTRALIQEGGWYGWRQAVATELSPKDCRNVAIAWLNCPVWRDDNAPEATLENWKQVIGDLTNLSGLGMQQLRSKDSLGLPRWPWITPFETRQIADLTALVTDLGALAELIEAINTCDLPVDIGDEVKFIYGKSRFARELHTLPADALLWLMRPLARNLRDPPALSLQNSMDLYVKAGHRQAEALQARVRSVIDRLREDPLKAMDAANDPNLWETDEFLSELAAWFDNKAALNNVTPEFLTQLDQRINPKLSPVSEPSPTQKTRAKFLAINEYNNIAEFLVLGIWNELPYRALKALLQNIPDDNCWKDICKYSPTMQQQPVPDHPLTLLAGMVYHSKKLAGQEGWRRFATVVGKNPKLLQGLSHPQLSLPAFDLTASFFGNGQIAEAAWRIVSIADAYRSVLIWWRALLRSLQNCRRQQGVRSVDDRVDMAVRAICDYANRHLDRQQQQMLGQALRLENMHDMAAHLHVNWELIK